MPSKHHPCCHETEAGSFPEKNYDRERRFFTTPASYHAGKLSDRQVVTLAGHCPCKPSPLQAITLASHHPRKSRLQVALAACDLRQGAAIRSEICDASKKAVNTAGTLMNLKN